MAIPGQLFRLERLDSDLRNLRQQLADGQKLQGRDPQVEAAEAQVENLRAREKNLAAEQRRLETDLSDLEARITRDRRHLYGGQVVDPRELASLEREIEHVRTQCGPLEERILTLMDELDGLRTELAGAVQRAHDLHERWEADLPDLSSRLEQTADVLNDMIEERKALASAIDRRALDLYEQLRRSSPHALSRVNSGVCEWCRVVIPAKDIQHARVGQLVTCPNCGRILHVGG